MLDPGLEEDLKAFFGPDGEGGGAARRRRGMAEREVDFLLIGGGMASANCAAELRKQGADGSIVLVGREPEPPYERPPLSKEYMRGEAKREDAYVNAADWYEENGVELRTGDERDVARHRGAGGEAAGRRRGGVREGADRHRREREHPAGRGGGAGRDPLPARLRQLGLDPRGGGEGEAGGADRRQLHRLRGGGVADGEGDRLRDRDDGGRGAVADVRRGGRAVLPRHPRVEGRRDPRRRDAGGVRGRRGASRRW